MVPTQVLQLSEHETADRTFFLLIVFFPHLTSDHHDLFCRVDATSGTMACGVNATAAAPSLADIAFSRGNNNDNKLRFVLSSYILSAIVDQELAGNIMKPGKIFTRE